MGKELGVRRLRLARTCAPEVKAGVVLEPEAETEPAGGASAAPDVAAKAEDEVGAGVVLGVDFGEAASRLRSFSCILRMTAVGVNDTDTELLKMMKSRRFNN